MSRFTETVAALATPAGTSAIAVLRISGPDTVRLTQELFGEAPPPRSVRRGDYRDRAGTVVDDVLCIFFQAPQSYTGEDALEISCHGNPFIAQKILEDLFARGCRAADPGEFTQRAFLNGRMDLSQAEAVMDLIHARSERALAVANDQLRGALGRRVQAAIDGLVGSLAQVEAYIDFPEEDLPPENRALLQAELDRISRETGLLLATTHYGELLRDGIKTVIIGAPNVGKSSLLNRLVGRDRALVSPEPGTTRDYIEERIVVGPHCLRLTDTAGLNDAAVYLEKLGIEKTMERAAEADLFLLVTDVTRGAAPLPVELRSLVRPDNAIVVVNKIDLPFNASRMAEVENIPVIEVSALTGEGLAKLSEGITAWADKFLPAVGAETVAINARHAQALSVARKGLEAAQEKLLRGEASELLASDLREALDAFGEIIGKIDNEKVLDRLFAEFCIGK